ncbi:MAG: SidA/IucD/PvdA family monooxygenase [Thermoanaerobaculia bacterium]
MTSSIYDLLGVGFGPANLALDIAITETAEENPSLSLSRVFLDSKPNQVWHPDLLLPSSLLQINVLKDLVTVVNPRSRFTFLNYLKEKGRLFEFLNLRDLFPTRIEFSDYLVWVSSQLEQDALFNREVERVEPVAGEDGEINLLRVVSRERKSGERNEYLAKNLVLATGGRPLLPKGIELKPGGRAFHPAEFLSRMERDFPDPRAPYRFVVIGSGQTGAELFDYLLRSYPNADVTSAIRRFAFKPVDESDFTNEIFFPRNTDFFFNLPDDKRREFFESLKDVNYAVVDHPLIRRIYRTLYDERVAGRDRARVLPFLELEGLSELPGQAEAYFRNPMTGERSTLRADAVVVATGFERPLCHPLLEGVSPYLETTSTGRYRVERDYSITRRAGFLPKIYLQGDCEESHGISETVLSLVPVRAQDILRSLHEALAAREAPAVVAG